MSFADTAGFRSGLVDSAGGIVEEGGIRQAKKKTQESDIIVVLAPVESAESGPVICHDKETLNLAANTDGCLLVINKKDAVDEDIFQQLLKTAMMSANSIPS